VVECADFERGNMQAFLKWLNENFVPAWKAVSILLTGAFGILGLVKDFKEKKLDPMSETKVERITKWGWISMVGIIVSTGLGVSAQLKESHDTSVQTLSTVNEIKKILSPLDIASVMVRAKMSCETDLLQAFCRDHEDASGRAKLELWPQFFDRIQVTVFICDSIESLTGDIVRSHFDFDVFGSTKYEKSEEPTNTLAPGSDGQNVFLTINGKPIRRSNDGKLRSIDDLNGKTIAVMESGYLGLDINDVQIVTSNAQRIRPNKLNKAQKHWFRGYYGIIEFEQNQ